MTVEWLNDAGFSFQGSKTCKGLGNLSFDRRFRLTHVDEACFYLKGLTGGACRESTDGWLWHYIIVCNICLY